MFSQRPEMKKVLQPLTFLICLECKTENSRPFKEGDYIFKEVDEKCPKCGASRMLITGIYVRGEEEEKS